MSGVVVLVSGGMDSALVLHRFRDRYRAALFVDYGQPNEPKEAKHAARIAMAEGVMLERVSVLSPFGSRHRHTGELETGRTPDEIERAGERPASYWPGRNAVLLTLAASLAEHLGVHYIAAGFNKDDQHGFPDCRPSFRLGMADALSCYGIKGIVAPLDRMTKSEVVAEAGRLNLPTTWSCYRDGDEQCGECDACVLSMR